MRVRDVEIALVLAREMKGAASRDVEASLRLQQLKEVFGVEELDRAERARIQTALQMAGLEPEPSLLEAGLDEPIRFAVTPDEAPAAAPAQAPAREARQEFPTVGEFTRSALGRFRKRRSDKQAAEVSASAVPSALPPAPEELEQDEPVPHDAEPEPPPAEPPVAGPPVVPADPFAETPAVHEPEPEPDEPEPDEPEPEAFEAHDDEPPVNGHPEPGSNGHSHFDFLDDAVLPPHDTATPADFGASAETIDFDDPRLEEELAAHEYEEPEPAYTYEPEPEPEHAYHPEPDPEPALAPQPEPAAAVPHEPGTATVEQMAAILLPAAAIPVLVASIAGWSFGIPFVALSLIAGGLVAGRRAGFVSTLRSSPAARTILKATGLVTVAGLAVSLVLANVGTKSTSSKPAAQKPTPKATPAQPQAAAPAHRRRHRHSSTSTTPQAPAPDPATSGLYRVSPGGGTTGTSTTPSGTSTTPSGTSTTPSGTSTTP